MLQNRPNSDHGHHYVSVTSFGWFIIEIQLVARNVGMYVLWVSHVIIRMRLKGFNNLNNNKKI